MFPMKKNRGPQAVSMKQSRFRDFPMKKNRGPQAVSMKQSRFRDFPMKKNRGRQYIKNIMCIKNIINVIEQFKYQRNIRIII